MRLAYGVYALYSVVQCRDLIGSSLMTVLTFLYCAQLHGCHNPSYNTCMHASTVGIPHTSYSWTACC